MLSQTDLSLIHQATKKAEENTSAKINVVLLSRSNPYQDFVLLYGLALGSLISFFAWAFRFVNYPWLLFIQLAVIGLIDFVPFLRCLVISFIPKRIRHHRAHDMAHREYMAHHASFPQEKPFILLFVSLRERYVHIVTNPIIHAQCPENWGSITDRFSACIKKEGLLSATLSAISQITDILKVHFPKKL